LASLQARSALRSSHPLLFINKLVSLTAFIILLGAGWIAVSYLKKEIISRWQSPAAESKASSAITASPVRADAAEPTLEARPLATPVRLVYACAEDKEHYHASTHLPQRCQRTALSEEAAIRRGLKHCGFCLPE
jgi:hypothetical protein